MRLRRAYLVIVLLGSLSACAPSGIEDEYGRHHKSFQAATAHRHASWLKVLNETEPLPRPLTGQAVITVPDRSEILAIIRRGRGMESEQYIQHNTDYMAVDSAMLPQVIARRNIFTGIEVFQGSGKPHQPPEGGYLVEYVFDIRGTHIFMTPGTAVSAGQDRERVELPRPWVKAPSDQEVVRGIMAEIEFHLRNKG